MKKVLYIHHVAGWGGSSVCLINLITRLNKDKYEPEVLLLKYSNIVEKLAEKGIKYSVAKSSFYQKYYNFFPHSEAGYVKWYNIYSFFRLSISWILSRYFFASRELGKHQFDIVHLNSSVLTDWLVPAKKRGHVIIHIREPFRKGKLDILHHFFKKIIRENADQIVAISEDNAKRIGIPSNTKVIYDYGEIPKNVPSTASYESRKILYLGGASTSKGFYILVDALDYLNPDIKVYFGGGCEITKKQGNILKLIKYFLSKARLRNAAIRKITSHPNAIMLGMINNVNDYLNEVCCLVSPFSVPHFSFPVVEANLKRKPVIGSDVEGMDEIIKHECTGLIVPKNNPYELAVAINSLAADAEQVKRFGEEGYKIAIQKYSPENVLQFELIYDRLLY